MKAINHLGKKRSGAFLSGLLALCILVLVAGCKKDPIEPDPDPILPPLDTTYTLNFKNGDKPITQEVIYVTSGDVVNLSWELKSSNDTISFEMLKDGAHLSYERKGEHSFTAVNNQTVFNAFFNGKKVKSQLVVLASEIPFPVINITVSDTSVAYNGTANVSWSIQYSTAQYLNSTQIPVSGNLQLTSLKRDTILHFSASNSNGVKYTNKDVTIHVGPPPPPTFLDYIQSHPWKHTERITKYFENDPWTTETLSAFELSLWNVFNTNGIWERFKPGPIRIASGSYTIVGSTLTWGPKDKIIELRYDIMVLEKKIVCFGCPVDSVLVRDTYVRYP